MGAALGCLAPPLGDGADAPYTLVRRLGRGAVGDVWLARERATGAAYALKFMRRDLAAWQARARRVPLLRRRAARG